MIVALLPKATEGHLSVCLPAAANCRIPYQLNGHPRKKYHQTVKKIRLDKRQSLHLSVCRCLLFEEERLLRHSVNVTFRDEGHVSSAPLQWADGQ